MKKIFLLLPLIVFLFGCKSDFEQKLVKSKWVLCSGTKCNDKWPNTYYRFYENGEYEDVFLYSDIGSRFSEDSLLLFWKYEPKDNKLIMSGIELQIISIEGDTIRMRKDTTNVMLYNIDKTHAMLKKGPGRCLGG
jgi:hypothetical protein